MRIVILFSGQGAQTLTHLNNLKTDADFSNHDAVRESLASIWANAPTHECDLHTNAIAQPLIFAWQMACWTKLAPRIPNPICVAGYSLGEMAAACAAGLFGVEAGLKLCVTRAQEMDACVSEASGLLAVKGIRIEHLVSHIEECELYLAIRNADDHAVVGGVNANLDRFEALAIQSGASKLTRLGVLIPSHTPILLPASTRFHARLDEVCSDDNARLQFPVMSAISGHLSRYPGTAKHALSQQLSQGLNWQMCMQTLSEMRPDVVLEIGPGNALVRMWDEFSHSNSAPQIPARSVDDFKSMEGVVQWLDKHCMLS